MQISFRAIITAIATSLIWAVGAVSAAPVPAGDGDSPLFRKMFAVILENTGLETNVVSAPPERRRRMFAQGRILIDCCATEEWRQRNEEIAVQLWSKPFFINRDRYVVHADATIVIRKPEDLRQHRVAVVHGFDYALSTHFGMEVPGRGWDAVLQLIEKKRADIAIIGEAIFWERQVSKNRRLKLGAVADEQPLSIRVHNSRPDLLPIINRSIQELMERGTLEAIVNTVAKNGSTEPTAGLLDD